jgi:hypothetical protein
MINSCLDRQISSLHRVGMQAVESLQKSPFSSTGGVTAADIEAIKTRIDTLEKNIMMKFDSLQAAAVSAAVSASTSTSTATPPVSGLSEIIPTPSVPPVDLASIFPKEGGSRRFRGSKRSKRSRKYRKK